MFQAQTRRETWRVKRNVAKPCAIKCHENIKQREVCPFIARASQKDLPHTARIFCPPNPNVDETPTQYTQCLRVSSSP